MSLLLARGLGGGEAALVEGVGAVLRLADRDPSAPAMEAEEGVACVVAVHRAGNGGARNLDVAKLAHEKTLEGVSRPTEMVVINAPLSIPKNSPFVNDLAKIRQKRDLLVVSSLYTYSDYHLAALISA